MKCNEVTKEQIFKLIDYCHKDCILINLFGGETLLRPDFEEILDYIKSKDIIISTNTNGIDVEKKIDILKKADYVLVSLDSISKENDSIRYKGGVRTAINAIKILRKNGIDTIICITITKMNYNKIMPILKLARKYGCKINLQEVYKYPLSSENIDNIKIDEEKFKEVVNQCLRYKELLNLSLPTYKYLINWPNEKVKCFGGKLLYHMEPDGKVYPCQNVIGKVNPSSIESPKDIFNRKNKFECKKCWVTQYLDFNKCFSLNIESIKYAIKRIKMRKKRDNSD
jgi:MoaA/NifB/PqqE/SkfB family radical SAM enzyme